MIGANVSATAPGGAEYGNHVLTEGRIANGPEIIGGAHLDKLLERMANNQASLQTDFTIIRENGEQSQAHIEIGPNTTPQQLGQQLADLGLGQNVVSTIVNALRSHVGNTIDPGRDGAQTLPPLNVRVEL